MSGQLQVGVLCSFESDIAKVGQPFSLNRWELIPFAVRHRGVDSPLTLKCDMTEKWRVRLEKEQHVFSAAHFITFAGNICERLHGHNYGVFVDVAGPLDENHYVIDFIALRDALTEITTALDHHVLLPTDHEQISVEEVDGEVVARFEDRRWVFPADDCVLLPVANTTAELIARYIGQTLLEKLTPQPTEITVGVDENHNQWGIWEHREK